MLKWSLSPCWVCKCSPGKDGCGWSLLVSGDFCLSAVVSAGRSGALTGLGPTLAICADAETVDAEALSALLPEGRL